jgi:lipoprotein-releasing system permease protein
MVLTTVMSVMNGFDYEIRNLVYLKNDHVLITSNNGNLHNWQNIIKIINQHESVITTTPIVTTEALLINNNNIKPIFLRAEQNNQAINNHYGITISPPVAYKLGLTIGDKVQVITPKMESSITGAKPRMKKFTVVDIKNNPQSNLIQYANLEDLQKLLLMPNEISALSIITTNLDSAPKLATVLQSQLGPKYNISSWIDKYSQLFKALQLQKTMMFLILMLIIFIAAFNMLASMIMLVADKRQSIASMRTLGMPKRYIVAIFMLQGLIVGVIGVVIGSIGGYILSKNVTEVVHLLEYIIGSKLIDKAVYMLDYLPSHFVLADLITINSVSLILSLAATIYPAYKASKIEPVELLRNLN